MAVRATQQKGLKRLEKEDVNVSNVVIRRACVVSVDSAVGDHARADMLVINGKIAAVGPDLEAPEGAEEVDAEGMILCPGFVDAHRHSWQTTIRNLNSDMFFYEYVTQINPRYGAAHQPEHKYAGVHLAALDALDSGVTTMIEYGIAVESPEDSDAMVLALKDAGVRAKYCHGVASDWQKWWTNSDLRHPMEDASRIKLKHFSSSDQLLTFGVALRGPEFTTPEANRFDFAAARDLGARITLHIKGPGAIAAMRDSLGDDTCYVHCCGSTDHDLELIRDSGGHVNVTPECEMGMHAPPVTHRLFKMGMKPSIGVDGAGTVSADMFTQMRHIYSELRMQILREGIERDGRPPFLCPVNTRDVLEWATIEGARQFGLDRKTGSLTPGKEADFLLISARGLNMTPLNHPVAAIVMNAGVRDIDSVYVAGVAKKRGGKLIGADIVRARELILQARDEVFQRAGPPDFFALSPQSLKQNGGAGHVH